MGTRLNFRTGVHWGSRVEWNRVAAAAPLENWPSRAFFFFGQGHKAPVEAGLNKLRVKNLLLGGQARKGFCLAWPRLDSPPSRPLRD